MDDEGEVGRLSEAVVGPNSGCIAGMVAIDGSVGRRPVSSWTD